MSLIYPVSVMSGGGGVTPPVVSYQVERSLRFNSPDLAYLSRTQAVPTSTQKWTLSCWIKRCALNTTNYQGIYTGAVAANANDQIIFEQNQIRVYFAGAVGCNVQTNAVFRDLSAWMHLVVAIDTTQATAINRIRIYANGIEITSMAIATFPAQNYALTQINKSGAVNQIGKSGAEAVYHDCYMADYYVVDGQQLTPADFAQTNQTTGQWEPIAYAGTYGTNGFYLKFADNSNTTAATLGKDSSGNSNNWTPNAFSVAAGIGNDSLVDTPTNYGTDTGVGGEVRGNYCTLNPLANGGTLANGNLDWSWSTASWASTRSTMAVFDGCYVEVEATSGANSNFGLSRGDDNAVLTTTLGFTATSVGYLNDGSIYRNSVIILGGGQTWNGTTASKIAAYYRNSAVWFGKLSGSTITWNLNGAASQAALVAEMIAGTTTHASATGLTGGDFFFTASGSGSGSVPAYSINFGQRAWIGVTNFPTGAKALCTQNLPDPAIVKPSQYFDVNLRTGTGAAVNVTQKLFQPDLVWIKSRNAAKEHNLFDAVRGVNSSLRLPGTGGETLNGETLKSFNADGFTLGTDVNAFGVNINTNTYVDWMWKEGVVPGFDIDQRTKLNATAEAFNHSLGVAPAFVISRPKDGTQSWFVWHKSFGPTDYIILETAAAKATGATVFSAAPTATQYFLGNGWLAATQLTYLFAEVPGFSRFSSYTGNGAADGTFVWCGFRPRFVMLKCSTGAFHWVIYDTERNKYNVTNLMLFPALNGVEASDAVNIIDVLSNGFKLRGPAPGAINDSGQTYIFAAFAESPFKYARAEKSPTPTGVVSNPAATSLLVTAPANAVNGVAFSFSVQAQAAGVNTTNYTGTIHFTSTAGGATLPADSTLVSGVKTFSATFPSAGTFTITATDTVTGSIVGTSGNITSAAVTPGSQTITTVGANSFTVPAFNTLSIEVWGAGGGGGGAGGGSGAGGPGGASTFVIGSLSAGGGAGGGGTGGGGGSGGVASGGDTNTNGSAGNGNPSNTGGAAANGGPGTGGNSAATGGGVGGGGGSYAKKTYTPATLTIGSNISIAVGGGGGGGSGTVPGTAGGNGKAVVTWS